MPDLISLSDFTDHIGDSSSLDFDNASDANDYLTALLDRVEDMLERATNVTFHTSGTASDETYDGNGEVYLWVDRPVDTLTKATVGDDASDPDETLDSVPDDIQADGRYDRRILRRDGGVWPVGRANVHVTYDYAAYQPEIAKQALIEGTAYLLRRRGAEHAASRTVGEFGATEYAALFRKLPTWNRAVSLLRVRKAS